MSRTLLDDFACGCELWEELDTQGEVRPDWKPCEEHKTNLEAEITKAWETNHRVIENLETVGRVINHFHDEIEIWKKECKRLHYANEALTGGE